MCKLKHCYIIILILLLTAHATTAWAEQQGDQIDSLASEIALLLDPGQPHILDIRAGEWTKELYQSLSTQLLQKGFDLREPSALGFDLASEDTLGAIAQKEEEPDIGILVRIELNLKWKSVEHKNFFSYRSERVPIRNFVIKQVQLPSKRVLKLDSIELKMESANEHGGSVVGLRWFEPLIAVTAIASIIFLLWTM